MVILHYSIARSNAAVILRSEYVELEIDLAGVNSVAGSSMCTKRLLRRC